MNVALRATVAADLPFFFAHQRDPEARRMVAFTPHDADDAAAFERYWDRILTNDGVEKRTIVVDGVVAGNIAAFDMFGRREIGYWIDRAHWGRGVATAALRAFLDDYMLRPLHARTAFDNVASQRVLEKCGFVRTGTDRGFAKARDAEIEETLFTLG